MREMYEIDVDFLYLSLFSVLFYSIRIFAISSVQKITVTLKETISYRCILKTNIFLYKFLNEER